MPPVRKATRRSSTARKRTTTKEPDALKRLNQSLDSAQDALAALRKDLSKDVGTGARDLYKDVQGFIREARRDSGKLGTALRRDVERAQKRLSASPRPKGARSSGARSKAQTRSTALRAGSRSGRSRA